MKNIKITIYLITFVAGFIFLFNGLVFNWLGFVQAGIDDNSSGYAWSENIGWISFNSTSGGGSDYGVQIDPSTGDLSGYAWSENIGWISFNRVDTGNPPAAPFDGGSGPIASYNSSTGELTGWMRALSYGDGWDGWIRFENASIDASGDWHGWAWGDMVVGWISFNGSDPGAGGNYKVNSSISQSPTATNLLVSPGDSATYCGVSANHYFSWTYSDPDVDDHQSRFQFQVDNNSDFSFPEIDRDYPGLSYSSPTTSNQIATLISELAYSTTYYWRVKVYDSQDADSGWIKGSPFITKLHQYPDIDFDWSPQGPSIGEDVLFADQTSVYGGAAKSSWTWTFTDGNPINSSQQNPTIQFISNNEKQVTLQVTDSDSYSCSRDKTINVQASLPGWKEK